MPDYQAPTKDIHFVMNELAGMKAICEASNTEEFDESLVAAIIDESAKFTSEVLSPLNWSGDQNPARVENKKVIESIGFSEAYKQFIEGGWMSIAGDPDFGGMGMPELLAVATTEMCASANLAFSVCSTLTSGAINAIESNANNQLKQKYLPKMVSGEWTGTMNLTEPQAGSDLAAVRTKATPKDDHYLIKGTKIFISWGDHQMTDNIIHLVLARTPDAPEGVKGISLFLVPKFLVKEDGSLGEHNDLFAVSVEHKMGIHASPTCVMSFGEKEGAIGYLIGEENYGLPYMFVMMNAARLHVGVQGLAVSERAYQSAVSYAKERVQGKPVTGDATSPIIGHPDVRRMLLQMRALTEASRAMTFVTAAEYDRVHQGDETAQARIDYLTPIIKGWPTEVAQEVTSLGVQICGGMGYVEETGLAQYMRDAKITTIYEGTTGIQALDLIGRKFIRDKAKTLNLFMEEMSSELNNMPDHDDIAVIKKAANEGLVLLQEAANWLLENIAEDFILPSSSAHHFLMLNGTVFGSFYMAKSAAAALTHLAEDSEFYSAKLITSRFYAEHIAPRAISHAKSVQSPASTVMSMDAAQF